MIEKHPEEETPEEAAEEEIEEEVLEGVQEVILEAEEAEDVVSADQKILDDQIDPKEEASEEGNNSIHLNLH